MVVPVYLRSTSPTAPPDLHPLNFPGQIDQAVVPPRSVRRPRDATRMALLQLLVELILPGLQS
jgi:hypothetical protein